MVGFFSQKQEQKGALPNKKAGTTLGSSRNGRYTHMRVGEGPLPLPLPRLHKKQMNHSVRARDVARNFWLGGVQG